MLWASVEFSWLSKSAAVSSSVGGPVTSKIAVSRMVSFSVHVRHEALLEDRVTESQVKFKRSSYLQPTSLNIAKLPCKSAGCYQLSQSQSCTQFKSILSTTWQHHAKPQVLWQWRCWSAPWLGRQVSCPLSFCAVQLPRDGHTWLVSRLLKPADYCL